METRETKGLEKTYNPAGVEKKWYRFWLDRGYFTPPSPPQEPLFSVVIPPPNITGSLHIGHALNNTLQDVLVRYQRMKGASALWVPGTDHAGIATEMMVKRSLAEQSKTRYDLGRQGFVDRVWQWKGESGDTIKSQLSRLGASPDWSRERFTMDEGLSLAVGRVFVELYREGLIYRDKRLVNWDPELHTAISDLEVEQREMKGNLWYIRYPLEDDSGEFIVVATTRPETMLGDTALAVHPDDERYKHLVGKNVILPIVGRPLPVIADEYSDPTKGSGAVKITPAHDLNDFEVGRRHRLPMVSIFDDDASLNENVPREYRGLDRYEAREKIVGELRSLGLLEKIEAHTHMLPYGDRSGVVVEPRLTDQWYVDAKALAEPAIEAVEKGRVRFVPERWVNTYYDWMRNIQPWCISRQIWWGHRIPAWYGPDGRVFVAMTAREALGAARKHYGDEHVELRQDEDVLDTWFSSALWPFSTLGWPEETSDLESYYPTSVLITGFDIIFFWVARMIMMGLRFMGDVPFRDVYIHGLIRDERGEKMSKTKGNAIDPLEIIEGYGADSLRFTLTALATQGRDIKLSLSVIEGYRNFMNKIWNASRFLFLNLEGYDPERSFEHSHSVLDRWILTKLNLTIRDVTRALEQYEFDKAAHAVYQFFWGDFCDWYIEFVKPSLGPGYGDSRARAQWVLVSVLSRALELLHPIAPFITEEIFQRLRSFGVRLKSPSGEEAESIMVGAFPRYDEGECDSEAMEHIEFVKETIIAIRNLRAIVGLHPSARVEVILYSKSDAVRQRLRDSRDLIENLARLSHVEISSERKPERAIAEVMDGLQVFLPVEGVLDVEREVDRLRREIRELDEKLGQSEGKLSNRNFLERAPEEVVERERERFRELSLRSEKLQEVLGKLTEINQ